MGNKLFGRLYRGCPPTLVNSQFLELKNLLQYDRKVEEHNHTITCLGIEINAKTGILRILSEKLQEIKEICNHWQFKKQATRNEIQKLAGKLIYIHRCVKPARLFINRILGVLHGFPAKGKHTLPSEIFKDICWFTVFLQEFNGTVSFHWKFDFTEHIYVDACLTGVGAKYQQFVYSSEIPEFFKLVGSIVYFEAVNVLVAIRVWGQYLRDRSVILWCDNWEVVNAFSNNKIKDSLLMAIVRSVWLYTAKLNINLRIQHIRDKDNHHADILSCWEVYKYSNDHREVELKYCQWHSVECSMFMPNFNI